MLSGIVSLLEEVAVSSSDPDAVFLVWSVSTNTILFIFIFSCGVKRVSVLTSCWAARDYGSGKKYTGVELAGRCHYYLCFLATAKYVGIFSPRVYHYLHFFPVTLYL